jgi:crotonobetainyl-CoA:carnitine CoA-transferase CaiB-like acyl-CoA transferase
MADAAPLAGIRAVERGSGLGASYAGFLLGALGAEVVRVEQRDAGLSRRDRALARGKRSVILDQSRPPDRARWEALVASADAVLTEDDGGPPVPSSPDAIRCRVSAWGGTSALPPDEALVAAATGAQAMQWSWDHAPVWLVTPIVGYMTGMLAALGVTAALFARRRGAPGQTVEVSGVGASFALNSGTYVTGRETRGSLSQFGDPRGQIATYSLFRASDGWLFIGALTPAFLVNLMTVLDRVFARNAAIERAAPEQSSPVAPTPENLAKAAGLYRDNCAGCHGTPDAKENIFAASLYPPAPQFLSATARSKSPAPTERSLSSFATASASRQCPPSRTC